LSEAIDAGTAEAASPAQAVVETTTQAVETPAVETKAEPVERTLDQDLAAVYEKNMTGRVRDESGRFVSTHPEAVEPQAEAPATAVSDQAPEAASAETATPSIPAPNSWSAEQKAKWEQLPPDTREYIAKRESEAHAQISRMGQQVKAIQPVAETLEQYREVFQRNNMDFQSGVKALLNAQIALEQNPVAAIQHLASAYGVDLPKLFGGQDGQASGQPQIAALEAQVRNLQQQLQETSQRVMTQAQRDSQAQLQTLESVVADFTKDKPDFDQIEADVMAMIPVIRQQKPDASPRDLLSEAYERATWVNPEARARRLEAERKAAEAKAAEEAKKRAEQAKKSASLNVRSSQSSQADNKPLDVDLAEIYRRRHG
jgi:hypothetical protein